MARMLPILLIAALWLISIIVELIFAPPYTSESWAGFHLSLICVVAVVGFAIWNWFFPIHPGCNLFFGFRKETDQYGNWRGEEGSCFDTSVGLVEVEEARCSDGKYVNTGRRYFCLVHDPRREWMRPWVKEHKIRIVPGTIKKLRFVSENP